MSLLIILNGSGPLASPPTPPTINPTWSPGLGAIAGLGATAAHRDVEGVTSHVTGVSGKGTIQ